MAKIYREKFIPEFLELVRLTLELRKLQLIDLGLRIYIAYLKSSKFRWHFFPSALHYVGKYYSQLLA